MKDWRKVGQKEKDLCSIQQRVDASFSDLPLPVDSDDATGGLVDSCDKDCLSTDAVHVDAGARLNVVEMDVAKLGDQVDDVILLTHLGIN